MRANRHSIDPIKPRDNYMYCHMALSKPLLFAHRLYLFISYDSHKKNNYFPNKVTEFLYEM